MAGLDCFGVALYKKTRSWKWPVLGPKTSISTSGSNLTILDPEDIQDIQDMLWIFAGFACIRALCIMYCSQKMARVICRLVLIYYEIWTAEQYRRVAGMAPGNNAIADMVGGVGWPLPVSFRWLAMFFILKIYNPTYISNGSTNEFKFRESVCELRWEE